MSLSPKLESIVIGSSSAEPGKANTPRSRVTLSSILGNQTESHKSPQHLPVAGFLVPPRVNSPPALSYTADIEESHLSRDPSPIPQHHVSTHIHPHHGGHQSHFLAQPDLERGRSEGEAVTLRTPRLNGIGFTGRGTSKRLLMLRTQEDEPEPTELQSIKIDKVTPNGSVASVSDVPQIVHAGIDESLSDSSLPMLKLAALKMAAQSSLHKPPLRASKLLSNKFRKRIRRNISVNKQLQRFKRVKRHQLALDRAEAAGMEGSDASTHEFDSAATDDERHKVSDLLYDTDDASSSSTPRRSRSGFPVRAAIPHTHRPMYRLSAFCTSESFEMSELIEFIENEQKKKPEDNQQGGDKGTFECSLTLYSDVLHIKQKSLGRDIFIFSYGVVVFFNIHPNKEQEFLQLMKQFENGSLTKYECEDFDFTYAETESVGVGGASGGTMNASDVSNDEITLGTRSSLEKLSVAFAVAQCTKLSVYEERISHESTHSQTLSKTLASTGHIGMSSREIQKKLGTLFFERNNVNLHFDVLDSPEFFWEEDRFKFVYDRLYNYLELGKRVDLLNKRLAIMKEFFDLLNNQMERKHANKLEWIVIWLIVFEVVVSIGWDMIMKDVLGLFSHGE